MAGVRVGTDALIRPGVASVTNYKEKQPLARPKDGGGKRSFRTALSVAAKQGYAKYRNQTLTVKRDFVPATTHQRSPCNVERLRCISWNSGGFSEELNAEFFKYLEVTGDIGFFSVQETHWGFDSEWSTSSWHLVHSSTGQFKSGGILFGMHAKHVDRDSIKWRSLVDGRLLHVRFVYKMQQYDVISIYQFALTFSNGEQKKEAMNKRKKLWKSLSGLLQELPLRSSIVLMGDFNATLETQKKVAGYGIKLGSQDTAIVEERHKLMDLLSRHRLCALNTWGRIITTYEHPQGSSQIDYICVRQSVSDGKSKTCGPLMTPLASWRSAGHKVLLADVPLNWRPWTQKPQYRTQLDSACSAPHPDQVAREACPSLERLSQSLRKHCNTGPSRLQKPPLRSLDVEIHHLWSQRCEFREEGSVGIRLIDCFRALRQHSLVAKAHRALRKAARERKRAQILELLQGAEDAARERNSRKIFQYVRLLSPKISAKKIHLRGAKGELLEPSQECTLLAEYARELCLLRAGCAAE